MDPEYFQLNQNTSLMGPTTEASHLSPTEEQWLQYKDTIQYQFLMCNMPLGVLVNYLSFLGLYITKAQLEYKLKKWGFSKNLNKSTWQYIDRKITKRKREGKDTDVIHSGKRLGPSTINKAINRHRETAIFAQAAQVRSPPASPTNPYLTVCAPPHIRMEFDEWPASLPWMQFRGTFLALARNFLGPESFHDPFDVIPRTTQTKLVRLAIGHPITQVQESDALTHVSDLASHIGKIMPEWYGGEHLQTAQTLLHCPGKDVIPHGLKFIIYQVSNGFLENLRDIDAWADFCDLLIGLGILDLQIDLKRLHEDDIVIRAFMENLFQHSISWVTLPSYRSSRLGRNLDLIRWLLSSGLDPNNALYVGWPRGERMQRPIEMAISSGHVELVGLLLNFDADINDKSFPKTSTMELALQSTHANAIKYRIIELLVRHDILKLVVDPTKALKVNHDLGPLFEETALSAAIAAGSDATDVVFNHLAFLDASQFEAPFITADTFIAAAAKGDDAAILRLHEICPTTGGTRNQRGIKPVQVAVSSGHLSTCELLLRLYDGYSPALLFLAAYEGHKNILQFLLQKGADANAIIDADDCPECTRVYSSFTEAFSSLSSPSAFAMLLYIVRVHEYVRWDCDPYGLGTLIENGARLTGGEVWLFAAYESPKTLLAALNAGGSPNERDTSGKSALQHAMDSGAVSGNQITRPDPEHVQRRFQVVKTLLQHGAELIGGELVSAIRYRDLDLVSLISTYHSDLKDTDNYGISALEASIAILDDDILRQVVEAYDGHYDPGSLCAAAEARNLSLIDLLLTNRPVQSDYHVLEGTAIGLVAMSGDLIHLQKLLQYLPDASEPNSALVSVFLDEYENTPGRVPLPNGKLFWRQPGYAHQCVYGSPLAIASIAQDTSGFEELLSKGYQADILTWTNIAHKQSFPHLELLAKYQQRLDAFLPTPPGFPTPLSIAMEEEANVNAPPAAYRGATALQLAAINGHLGIARCLIDRGARINARGAKHHGRTALEGAAEHGRLDMMEFLIHHGALITGNGRGQFIRAVQFATKEGFYTAASLMKRRGGWTKEDEGKFKEGWRFSYPNESCCDELHDLDTECIHDSFDSEKETLCVIFMAHDDDREFPEENINREECYGRYGYVHCSDSDCVFSDESESEPESELEFGEEGYENEKGYFDNS
ncbi:hypothetical protein FSARC_13768 [Fusarium sarcochroum]|uniref:Clr5 domain-containing protein n=1 Tax=Fusarium sarcochroum TaxID=1208366 RepID=A0A8H4SZB7_9HYPO|nr:hypothetical protein FSARC_13768 [Fusarium sarcochroum]